MMLVNQWSAIRSRPSDDAGGPMATEQRSTFCRVCEPACGLIATVEDGRLIKLQPDREHPITKGFACPKGLAGAEIQNDPDRLDHPFARAADGTMKPCTWDEALEKIAAKLAAVIGEHG